MFSSSKARMSTRVSVLVDRGLILPYRVANGEILRTFLLLPTRATRAAWVVLLASPSPIEIQMKSNRTKKEPTAAKKNGKEKKKKKNDARKNETAQSPEMHILIRGRSGTV